MTLPPSPCGTFSDVSRTSRAFSLKIARISFSSAVSSVSPFGVTLPTSRSPGADLGADADDAALVEVRERLLRAVRDVARDLLVAELRRAGVDLVLVDVDRAEHVVADEPLRDDDRVLEVEALPRHERDEEVRAERELAAVGRAPVREHLALLHLVAERHDRLLVDERALVRAHELRQRVLVARCRGPRRRSAPRRRRRPRRRSARARRRPCPRRRGTRGRCRRAAPAGSSAAPPASACSRP